MIDGTDRDGLVDDMAGDATDEEYHVYLRRSDEMPERLKQALEEAYRESFPVPTEDIAYDEDEHDSVAVPSSPSPSGWASLPKSERLDLVRSLLGLLALLLGTIGITTQIVLASYGILPTPSWLWMLSAALGFGGLASLLCDMLRIYRDRAGDGRR